MKGWGRVALNGFGFGLIFRALGIKKSALDAVFIEIMDRPAVNDGIVPAGGTGIVLGKRLCLFAGEHHKPVKVFFAYKRVSFFL